MADRSLCINVTTLVHKGPCIVKSVHISADGADAYCRIYDGENSRGKLMAHLESLTGYNYTWRPGDGTDFDSGIYIAVNAITTFVTTTFEPESKKDYN